MAERCAGRMRWNCPCPQRIAGAVWRRRRNARGNPNSPMIMESTGRPVRPSRDREVSEPAGEGRGGSRRAPAQPSAGGPDPPLRQRHRSVLAEVADPSDYLGATQSRDHRRHAAPGRENGNAAMTFDLTATQLCNRR